MPYIIHANQDFTPKGVANHPRAEPVVERAPSTCSCGAGDDAVVHASNCAMILDFEESLREADRKLEREPYWPGKGGRP